MLYTIGEMAKKLNVPPSTLRYYDKEGLLPFVERSKSGIRMFKESDIEWLLIIECLKTTGLPLKQIKTFIHWCMEGDATIENRLNVIKNQKQAVEEQIARLQNSLDTLNYKNWYYETAKKDGTCANVEALAIEHLPEEYQSAKKDCSESHNALDLKSTFSCMMYSKEGLYYEQPDRTSF